MGRNKNRKKRKKNTTSNNSTKGTGTKAHKVSLSGDKIAARDQYFHNHNYGLIDEDNISSLEDVFGGLGLKSPLIHDLNRLNCDRRNLTSQFDEFYENNCSNLFQFYLIVGKAFHQPDHFAARLIHNLDDDFDTIEESIYFRRNDIFHGIHQIEVDIYRKSKIKQKFSKGFSQSVTSGLEESTVFQNIQEFISSEVPSKKNNYIALLYNFRIDNGAFNFHNFITWLNNEFCNIEESKVKFLFFLTFTIEDSISESEYQIINTNMEKIVSDNNNLCLLNEFSNIEKKDVISWLERYPKLTRFDAEKVTEHLILELDNDKNLSSKYFDRNSEEFQMSYIQTKINEICNFCKKNYI